MTGQSETGATKLTGAAETLLIPLASRARASKEKLVPGFTDPEAEKICAGFNVDLNRYAPGLALIRHRDLGLIVKRISERTEAGVLIVSGDNRLSASRETIGPVKPDAIEGVILWRIGRSGFSKMRRREQRTKATAPA
ncbi:MAG: S24/S26 family peptidase [Hyphomonas sp.]|jgi:hypothetical protein|tara:strand:- start:15924 stop:16337 length:414 start_codon:yes stop_codon:yes gene_type:complete